MIRTIKIILIIAVFFFGLLFFIQNNGVLNHTFTLTLNLYGTPYKWVSATEVPYFYPILIAFALGAFLAALYFFMDYARFTYKYLDARRKIAQVTRTLSAEVKRLQAQVATLNEQLEKEITQLPAGAQENEASMKDAEKDAIAQS